MSKWSVLFRAYNSTLLKLLAQKYKMSEPICEFDKLFNKNVPHIIEKIFYNLDCESFNRCREVSSKWKDMLMSERYHERLRVWQAGEDKLIPASMKGNLNEVIHLISIGVSPNCERYRYWCFTSPLAGAASYGHRLVVQLLLDHGADPNMEKNPEYTPLYNAASGGYIEVVKLLLQRGAYPNPSKGGSPGSPLIAASVRRDTVAVKLLLDYGANPNLTSESPNRATALHIAVGLNDKNVAKLLLGAGADPNMTDSHGRTSLHLASGDGNHDMVKLLLDSGADPEKADVVGVTALETAIDRGHEKVVARFIITCARPDARVEERIQEMNNSWILYYTMFWLIFYDVINRCLEQVHMWFRN